jgi:hypothetical protein
MPSLQVGAFCYADQAAAAVASCAGYPLAIGPAQGGLSSVECVGVSTAGNLIIQSGTQSLPCTGAGCAWSYVQTEITPTFPPCWHGDVVDAGMLILAAVLLAWVPCYGIWRASKFLNTSRADVI